MQAVTGDEQAALGWTGVMLRGARPFEAYADMVVTVDPDKLARRRALHPEPCTTAFELSLWEAIPAFSGPPSPVRLAGLIFDERDTRNGRVLPAACRWREFAPTAIRSRSPRPARRLLRKAGTYGIAVLAPAADGQWRLVQPGDPAASSRRTAVDRLLEEQMYGYLIRAGVIETGTAGH